MGANLCAARPCRFAPNWTIWVPLVCAGSAHTKVVTVTSEQLRPRVGIASCRCPRRRIPLGPGINRLTPETRLSGARAPQLRGPSLCYRGGEHKINCAEPESRFQWRAEWVGLVASQAPIVGRTGRPFTRSEGDHGLGRTFMSGKLTLAFRDILFDTPGLTKRIVPIQRV
jgi:hypothetical protein